MPAQTDTASTTVPAGAAKVTSSVVLLLLESLLRLGVTAVISFWIARQLGPEQFGILNFASAFVAIMLSAAAMGMDTPLILKLTTIQQPGALLGTALAVRAVTGLLMLGIAAAIALALKGNDTLALTVVLIVCLSIPASIPHALDYLFMARTDALRPALARLAGTLGACIAKLACLLLGLGVVALACTVLLEALLVSLGFILAWGWYARSFNPGQLTIDRQIVTPLLRESLPYLYSAIAVVAYMKIDVVMLGYLSSNAETGIYSLTQKLSEVLYIVPVVLIDSAYPTLARRFLDSGETRHGQLLFDLAFGGALLATLTALAVAAPVIATLFGDAYRPSAEIFHLHAWSCLAIALNTARHRWLAVVGLQRHAPTVTIIGLLLNVAMNLVLIPRLGAYGAAIATVVSYFVSGYLTSLFLPPLRDIGRMQTRALWPWGRLFAAACAWRKARSAT